MKNKNIWIIFLVGLLAVAYFYSRQFFEIKNLPLSDTEANRGQLKIKNKEIDLDVLNNGNIKITDNVKHSIALEEILSGGPAKDGIPPIDNPKFIKNSEASFLNNNDEGIGFVDDEKVSYFLPFRILVWHEIVNMKIAYKNRANFPISVTYCPLCRTGVIYEGVVDGEDTTFGTSGKLWQSNLIMYDRQEKEENESLWSQVLGEAVVGEKTGKKLDIFTSAIVDYGTWKSVHTNTKVLSTDTGNTRDYFSDPYGPSYYKGKDIYFPVHFVEEKIHPKELVLGIEIEGNFLAYKKEGLEKIDDTFGSSFISITKNKDGSFALLVDGKEHPYLEGFWFSWKSVHPSAILK